MKSFDTFAISQHLEGMAPFSPVVHSHGCLRVQASGIHTCALLSPDAVAAFVETIRLQLYLSEQAQVQCKLTQCQWIAVRCTVLLSERSRPLCNMHCRCTRTMLDGDCAIQRILFEVFIQRILFEVSLESDLILLQSWSSQSVLDIDLAIVYKHHLCILKLGAVSYTQAHAAYA